MSYYHTLTEDLEHAKAILERGKNEFAEELSEHLTDPIGSQLDAGTVDTIKRAIGGMIYGADTFTAYKLLESFVEAIEAVGPKVCELAVRQNAMRWKDYNVTRLGERQAPHAHIPGCTCIIVNGQHRSTERGGCPVHPSMTRLNDEDRRAALVAWEGRRTRHQHDQGTPRFIDNSSFPAGAPMVFTCLACSGWVILAEDFLTAQALCYDCRDLADKGWIVQADGAWVKA